MEDSYEILLQNGELGASEVRMKDLLKVLRVVALILTFGAMCGLVYLVMTTDECRSLMLLELVIASGIYAEYRFLKNKEAKEVENGKGEGSC